MTWTFTDSPEYIARKNKPFTPPTVTLKEIHDAVPKHLLKLDPVRSALYVARDLLMAATFLKLATYIDPLTETQFHGLTAPGWQTQALRFALWGTYYWFQGLVGAGMFCLGHDAGHGTLFASNKLNNVVGFTLHTTLLIPYFAWRSTHHAHHKATSSIERDENYVPYLRSDYKLPAESKATKADYAEIFEETPIYTLFWMGIMQWLGWWLYLTYNAMGSKMYPPYTSHWLPSSPLFKPKQRNSMIASNVALACMVYFFSRIGWGLVAKYYLVPYLWTNYWIVMFTYLHHSDPTIPHYRKSEWSFLRGASATVDRPLLGWMGRFFMHNISHDHIAHHFFVGAPFYNGPQITKAIKEVLGESYNYDSSNTLYAFYRSFSQCMFIEDEGDIVFYKNRQGEAVRELAPHALKIADVKAQDNVRPEEDLTFGKYGLSRDE